MSMAKGRDAASTREQEPSPPFTCQSLPSYLMKPPSICSLLSSRHRGMGTMGVR